MAPFESDRFISIMGTLFRRYVDEIYGPYLGPGGPRMRLLPPPIPWRELDVAYQVASLADAMELANEGTGVALLSRFADDPEFLCGTRPPGWHRPPHKEERAGLDRAVLGAALVFVAEGIGSEAVAGVAREAGQRMIG